MGNMCACCNWGRGGSDTKGGKPKTLDKKNAWFEQDSVPLVSARHGLDEIGSDEADGSLKRTVLIRSPRLTTTSSSGIDERSSRASRHLQQQHEQELRQHHVHRVKSASVDSSNRISRRSNRGEGEELPRSHNKHRHHHSRQDDDRDRRIARSTSLEVQDSTREMRSPSSSTTRSPRGTSHSQDAAFFADDEVDSVDSFQGSTRSRRSSSTSSSPKASSRSGSPRKKPRYGRKNYRANVSLLSIASVSKKHRTSGNSTTYMDDMD